MISNLSWRAAVVVIGASALLGACASGPKPVSAPASPRNVDSASKALPRARALVAAGRLSDAAEVLDAFLASAPPGKPRNEALEMAVFVRMCSDPRVMDLARARMLLAERRNGVPPPERAFELMATQALLDQAVRLTGKLSETDAEVRGAEERAVASSRELRQLRTENSALRGELKDLRDALKRAEEALQKVAATVVSSPRRR